MPSEYNEYLAKDSEEYKKWKSLQDGGAEAMEALTLKDKAPGAPAAAAEGARHGSLPWRQLRCALPPPPRQQQAPAPAAHAHQACITSPARPPLRP